MVGVIVIVYSKQTIFIDKSLFLFLIGRKLLCNVLLVSALQQHESAISIHISPPSWAWIVLDFSYIGAELWFLFLIWWLYSKKLGGDRMEASPKTSWVFSRDVHLHLNLNIVITPSSLWPHMEFRKMVLVSLVDNRLVDTTGEGEGGLNWEGNIDIYMLSHVK